MRIEVTQEDINHGIRGYTWACPIAMALRGLTSKPWMVGISTARLGEHCLDLPSRARKFIAAFDARGARGVRPFAFNLDIPA